MSATNTCLLWKQLNNPTFIPIILYDVRHFEKILVIFLQQIQLQTEKLKTKAENCFFTFLSDLSDNSDGFLNALQYQTWPQDGDKAVKIRFRMSVK